MSHWTVRLRSVRVRTTAAATVVVALFLGLGAVGFAVLQRHRLEATVSDAARQQAFDVSAQVAQASPSGTLPGGAGDQSIVQILDSQGTVIASSPSLEGEPPISPLDPGVGKSQTQISNSLPIGEGDRFVLVARGAQTPDGPVTILVAQSLELVNDATAIVVGLLIVGYPLVLGAVAVTSYWLVGRALAPVEAIRTRVSTIHGTSRTTERVPVPDTRDEISRLAETMNAMLGRLQDANASQRRFVADASHELRSPLATIRASHEVAALHPDAQNWGQTTRDVLTELDRVDQLVADLLLLARADEHGVPLKNEDVDIDDLLHQEGQRIRRLSSLKVDVDSPPLRVRGDVQHLARAVRNLTDNAARHAATRIELRGRHLDGTVTIEVTDDGPGIPVEDRERVFDRFVRLDQSRTRSQGGAGLGLPIAREIARSMDGSLTLRSAPGSTTFSLALPVPAT